MSMTGTVYTFEKVPRMQKLHSGFYIVFFNMCSAKLANFHHLCNLFIDFPSKDRWHVASQSNALPSPF